MDRVLEGVCTFQRDVFPQHQEHFQQLVQGQNPEVLFVTCADSRVVPNLITQTRPGDLFICRNAGNMVPPYGEVHGGVSATIEYAVDVLGVNHIVVCGHTDCGAMKGVLHPDKVAHLPAVKTWLNHGELARRIVEARFPHSTEEEKLSALIEANVVAQIDHLRTHPSVAARLARRAVQLHGWVYNIGTGHVTIWDQKAERFIPVEQYRRSAPADVSAKEAYADISK
ncbi:MAG TPA: carbonic anhydrase [Bryobacteraceae bacterium]|nr:carbonic anhydrase [Bryobacteraceae bacterium]